VAVIGGTEILASFRIGSGSGGVSSLNGMTGAITIAAGANTTVTNTSGTITIASFGTIAGTIATGQVAFGTGANTIGGTGPSFFGSASLFWDSTKEFLTIVSSVNPDTIGENTLFLQNNNAPSSGVSEVGIFAEVQPSSLGTTSGSFYGIQGVTNLAGGNVSGIVAGVVGNSNVNGSGTAGVSTGFYAQPNGANTGSTIAKSVGFYSGAQAGTGGIITLNAAFYAVNQTSGASNFAYYSEGGKNFFGGPQGTEFGGQLTLDGATSGKAILGVAAVAGTPNRINLPIATGAAGTFLQTDGANPQQTSWVALTGTTLVASGTAVLNTAAIPAVTAATVVTVAGAGILSTDSIEWAFNATPGTGYTTGLHVLAFVSTGNVNFSVVNPTAGALTPAAATLNWRVIR
jgi:hypothetical protein